MADIVYTKRKTKTKTEVTYEVEWRVDARDAWKPDSRPALKSKSRALRRARLDTRFYAYTHRVVRVERTVVAEVKL